jgi:16S rRNA (cytidine1402-2'-O)-methyltransferase
MNSSPALLLLPNLLGNHASVDMFLPHSVTETMQTIDGLIAESDKEGRRYLKRFATKKPAMEIPIALLNEHTVKNETSMKEEMDFLLEPIVSGERWGLVTDAGLPCIADPGSNLVLRARQRGIPIEVFVGPSSMLMALLLSGLPGQKFAFQGYLDKGPEKQQEQIKRLSEQSQRENITHIVMEAPYRNRFLLERLIQILPEKAYLSVAWDLTLPTQGVVTLTIQQWRSFALPNIEKKPAVFLFYVGK